MSPRKKIDESFLTEIHELWIDLKNRELWLHSVECQDTSDEPGVEYMMATRIIKNLHVLKNQSNTKPVLIHMHTGGGYDDDGYAIYDTIRLMPYPVTIINYTRASSMSSIIFQAATTRVMLPHSYFMFHYGSMGIDGNAKTVYSAVDFARKNQERMLDIYVERVSGVKKVQGMGHKQGQEFPGRGHEQEGRCLPHRHGNRRVGLC